MIHSQIGHMTNLYFEVNEIDIFDYFGLTNKNQIDYYNDLIYLYDRFNRL